MHLFKLITLECNNQYTGRITNKQTNHKQKIAFIRLSGVCVVYIFSQCICCIDMCAYGMIQMLLYNLKLHPEFFVHQKVVQIISFVFLFSFQWYRDFVGWFLLVFSSSIFKKIVDLDVFLFSTLVHHSKHSCDSKQKFKRQLFNRNSLAHEHKLEFFVVVVAQFIHAICQLFLIFFRKTEHTQRFFWMLLLVSSLLYIFLHS